MGKVVDANGEPIIGATIKEKGASNGTVTDLEGSFRLDISTNAVLEISYIGYQTQEWKVENGKPITVTLKEDTEVLSEVVVVGYGVQKKVNLTGAVTAVDKSEIAARPVGQLSTALQGMAPGVTVTTNSGQPGLDTGTIRIRGRGTLNDNDPLVLIDGIEGNINDVDANDIESMSILKDAAASSIYGVRAANGVILITTKRGESGQTKITYSNYVGWQSPTRMADYVGAQDFMKLSNLVAENSDRGANYYYSQEQIAAYDNPNRDLNKYADNNWIQDILTGSGFQQEHSLGLQGGNEGVKYALSANYLDQSGLIQNMDFERFTLRLNTDIKVSEQIRLNVDLSARLANRSEPRLGAWGQFGTAHATNPTYVNKYTDGTWAVVRGENNIMRIQEEGGLNEYKSNLYTAGFNASYQPFADLKFTGIANFKMRDDYNSLHQRSLIYSTNFPENSQFRTIGMNNITKQSDKYAFTNYQGLANYSKTLSKHHLALLMGVSYLKERGDNLTGYRTGIPNGELTQINAGGRDGQNTTGSASEYGLFSLFGRLNYSYQDKYLLEANIRRDGSSRFSKNQRWGWFPSFSAGWRISEEAFLKEVETIDNLKLRASWGELGNDKIGNYPYQTTYSLGNYPFGGTLNQTAGMSVYPNTDLTWETTRMTNIGLDFSTLSNRLSFTFDYYVKTTRDILMRLPILSMVGLSAPYQNAGKVQNKGWEVAVNYSDKIGTDFHYSVGFNLSDVKNEVLDIKGTDRLSSDNNNNVTGLITGKPINSYYGYQALGLYQTQEQLQKYPGISSSVGLGDIIYQKQTESGSFSFDDMVYQGSNIPRYTYGVNLGAEYRGFDFSAFLQGVAKVSIHTLAIEKAPMNTDGNFRSDHLDSWTATNTDAQFPRLVTTNQNYQSSSFWIKSGAYLRLKNVQLGYTLPKSILAKTPISKCRIYASGINLLTLSGLPSDIDPESPNDARYYPQVKTYTFGVNLEF
ncbi:MAG: SusC/RagA family TonB-linked outer membrane protein [Phocaeicola sp.]